MPIPRKYGVGSGADIWMPIIKRAVVDGAVGADWTPAAGDVKISIDGAAVANIGTLPVALAAGNTAWWKFVFTDAELQGKTILISISDSATKAIEDQWFIIETFGHASAKYQADFSLPNLPANVTQLLGTAWLTPGTAGTPDVNTKLVGGTTQTAGDIIGDTNDIQARLPAALTVDGNIKADTLRVGGTLQTAGDLAALVDAVDNFVDTEVAAIIATLGTAGAGLTGIPWNAAWDPEVQSEVADALDAAIPVSPTADSINERLKTIDNAYTATRAGYLDNINNGNLSSVPAFPSNFASLGINISGHISRVTLTDTTTTNTDMITAAGIRTAVGLASANLDTQLAAIDDYIDTEILALTSTVGALFTTARPQSYRTAGATATIDQMLYEIIAHLGDCSISGTTKTLNNLAGTAAKTFTLNSSTTPNSITETT